MQPNVSYAQVQPKLKILLKISIKGLCCHKVEKILDLNTFKNFASVHPSLCNICSVARSVDTQGEWSFVKEDFFNIVAGRQLFNHRKLWRQIQNQFNELAEIASLIRESADCQR
jgi:hypothetical protein